MMSIYKIIESTEVAQKAGCSKYTIMFNGYSFDYVYIGKYNQKWFNYIEQKGLDNLTQDELREIYNDVKRA